tara:strand:+ start:2253 stop:2753 length:501 start_codon:yes stop_codon:yes gene_type:complete
MNYFKNFRELRTHLLKKENIFYLILTIFIFLFDRFSKSIIINDFSDSTYYLNDYANLDLIWNSGIGFGFLSTNSSLTYNLVTLIIGLVLLFLIYIFVISSRIDKIIYSIIIGGGLGNFFDRLIYKAVPDFLDIHYENFHWFTFNVADIFITLGIMIFILRSFLVQN